jgi:L-lactate dehydrogenase complex protein LldE
MPINVSFFIGCLNDVYYPQVGVAAVKVLEHFGCQVDFPIEQTCCGASLYQDGYNPQSRDLARRFVGLFRESEFIVTPSPRCCAMVREEYTRLLLDDPKWEQPMWQVAGRTYEFVEFLTTVLKADLSKLSLPKLIPATYHPACQLRSMGVGDATPGVLRQIKNVDLKTLNHCETCCGAGGGLLSRQGEISDHLRNQKMVNLNETGAVVGICNEAVCALRLGKGPLPLKHVAELIAEGLGIGTEHF